MSSADGSVGLDRQQSLALEQPHPQDELSFISSACNAEAGAAVSAWRAWPGGKLVMVGPEGAGKTHLAMIWARAVGARVLGSHDDAEAALGHTGPILIEDADRRTADETLFHLIDRADAASPLLITARIAPRAWATDLPDLRSRLNALMVAELNSPDDVVLSAILERFFKERNIRARKSVLEFLVRRIERSAPAARAVVERIDEVAAAERREITRDLAREVLGLDADPERAAD